MAATVETVARVGPCEAKITLVEIRDVRETKRKKIIERAAELLKEWDQKSLEPSEIEEKIETDIKLGEIISWGPEQLPAGPEVDINSELIIVEGRADVLNLLRIGLKNSIAVQGTQVPKSIIDLSKQKETVIAFVDGDRGGTIILNELLQLAKIDYIARAPEGYEVEELTRKQMIKSLQNKKALNESDDLRDIKTEKEYSGKDATIKKLLKKIKIKNYDLVIETINNLSPGVAISYNKNMEKLFELPIGELFDNLGNYKDSKVLIIDGILTKRLLSLILTLKIKFIACKNKEEALFIPDSILVFFF